MKKYYFLVGLFFVWIQLLTAQCPTWLSVDSQSDIDSFLLEYPNCTELPKIYLDDLVLDNLNGLINIETITGDVLINDIAGLINLDGLQNLSFIGGSLKINYNPDLLSISALSSLETLVGDLDIKENPPLTTIDGLEGLTTVSSIDIEWNEALASLDGLQNISSVTGAVRISYAWPVSTLAPLANLTSVGSLFLGYLPLVTDLQGLHNLENIHSGDLSLSSLGIANLEDLNIDTIGGGVSIINCDNLISLSALADVTWSASSLFTEVHIFANELLTNLDGLEGITDLYSIWIIDNPLLSSIVPLSNAVVSHDIIIEQNPTLNSCAIYPVCAFNGTGTFSIIDNGVNCLDEATVMADCINNSSSAAGTTFLDLDCDAVYGAEDFPLSNQLIFRNPDGLPFAASNEDGAYFGFLPNEVTWTLYPQPISGFTVLPEEHTITTGATASFFTGLDFGFCPDSVFVDYVVDITAFVPAVPGFSQSYEICVQNL
ncbi:MAG: hypothetical protein KDC44_09125, partial [Phaeodactylibacter sp.]|nr:hypothetical protein [Phaeodactylibacter sp.]